MEREQGLQHSCSLTRCALDAYMAAAGKLCWRVSTCWCMEWPWLGAHLVAVGTRSFWNQELLEPGAFGTAVAASVTHRKVLKTADTREQRQDCLLPWTVYHALLRRLALGLGALKQIRHSS